MNIAETFRSLWRRWYIVVPGMLLAIGLSVGLWNVQTPEYQRSATQMLLPGSANVPDGANPYIYIGGLTQAADVVVRALGARNVVEEVVGDRPGVEVQVARDPSASGPLIVITVTARTDADAEAVLGGLVARTGVVLSELQDQEDIGATSRIKVIPVTADTTSILLQRDRLILAAGAGLAAVVLTLVLAVAVDGLVVARSRRRRRAAAGDAPADAQPGSTDADAVSEADPGVPEEVAAAEPDEDPAETAPVVRVTADDAAAKDGPLRDDTSAEDESLSHDDRPVFVDEESERPRPVAARHRWNGARPEIGLGRTLDDGVGGSPRTGRGKRALDEAVREQPRRSA